MRRVAGAGVAAAVVCALALVAGGSGNPGLSAVAGVAFDPAQFTPPAGSDGVIVRLVRDGCSSPVCPASGRVWFDDLSISRR